MKDRRILLLRHQAASCSTLFAAGLIYIPALNSVFGTAPLAVRQLAIVVPFPFIAWAADELSRLLVRHHHAA